MSIAWYSILAEWVLAIKWLNTIGMLAGLSCLFPLIVGAKKYRRLGPGLQLLTVNLLIAFIVEIVAVTLLLLYMYTSIKITNQFVYNLYTPVEFVLFILMFRHWHENTRLRGILTASIPLFLVLWTGAQIWLFVQGNAIERQLELNYIFLPVEGIILIIVSIITLFKIIRDETMPVVSNPIFWITAGLLFFFTGNLFIYMLLKIILEDSQLQITWVLHTGLNFLKYVLFAVGLIIAARHALPEGSSQQGA